MWGLIFCGLHSSGPKRFEGNVKGKVLQTALRTAARTTENADVTARLKHLASLLEEGDYLDKDWDDNWLKGINDTIIWRATDQAVKEEVDEVMPGVVRQATRGDPASPLRSVRGGSDGASEDAGAAPPQSPSADSSTLGGSVHTSLLSELSSLSDIGRFEQHRWGRLRVRPVSPLSGTSNLGTYGDRRVDASADSDAARDLDEMLAVGGAAGANETANCLARLANALSRACSYICSRICGRPKTDVNLDSPK